MWPKLIIQETHIKKNLFMFLIKKKKLLQIFKNKHGIVIHVIEFNQKNGIQEMMKFS